MFSSLGPFLFIGDRHKNVRNKMTLRSYLQRLVKHIEYSISVLAPSEPICNFDQFLRTVRSNNCPTRDSAVSITHPGHRGRVASLRWSAAPVSSPPLRLAHCIAPRAVSRSSHFDTMKLHGWLPVSETLAGWPATSRCAASVKVGQWPVV